jgi:hypothetical protein
MTNAEKVRYLTDALNDIISLERKMHLKGELKPGKLLPSEIVNMSVGAARDALETVGARVRKTGRI